MAALPGDRLSAALMVKSHGTVSVDGKVSDADLTYLEEVANSTGQEVDKSRLTSQAFARAALITDVGIALATELETAGQKWSLGFTPKFQRVDLFNYNVLVRIMTAAPSKATATTTRKWHQRRHRCQYGPG